MMKKKIIEEIKKEAQTFFKEAKGSHDFSHTERVHNLCVHIGEKEKAKLDVLKIASLLHDIGRSEQDNSKGQKCHAEKGALLAKKILKNHALDKELMHNVIHCIQRHRFRGKKAPETKEAKILFDADKLDSIGAVGIGRAFLFSGEVGATVHNKDVDVEKTRPYTREDTAYREFLVKLRKIKDRMLTKEGKKLAQERHEFMLEFFKRLDKEVDAVL